MTNYDDHMGMGSTVGKHLAPKIINVAPQYTTGFVREALKRAIDGVGPLPSAVTSAEKRLVSADQNVDKAVRKAIEFHVEYAGVQGFATNLGGLITAAASIPANITGLALIQLRMVAVIAHLRGHDLEDPRVRNAILLCLLGEDSVKKMVKKKKVPASPMALATAPMNVPGLDSVIATEVATELITKVAGKRLATTVGKRIPVIGGVVGMSADAWATWRIGHYAARELLARPSR